MRSSACVAQHALLSMRCGSHLHHAVTAVSRRYILENLEEQRQKEEEIAALSGELRSMGVSSVGFFDSTFRRGNPRARGRFGRGAASTGRGGGGSGYDAPGAHYSESAGPERFAPARGGMVFARGGRGGRGRGAPAYNAGAAQSAEAQTYAGDARGAGGGSRGPGGPGGSVAAVQRAQGVVVTLSSPHPPTPAPRQPPPPAATQPQGAQQRQVQLFRFFYARAVCLSWILS
jgi:hypothetical protein